MQILRDAATLGILILLALSVRIDLGGVQSGFGDVHAASSEPMIEEVQEPVMTSAEESAADLPLEANVRSLTTTATVLPFPDDGYRIQGLGNGRILIIIDDEVVDATTEPPSPAPAGSPACEKPRAHRSC